jgi:hypothetical protein
VNTRPEMHFSAADHPPLPKHNIEILIVESSPADTRLTCEAKLPGSPVNCDALVTERMRSCTFEARANMRTLLSQTSFF